jgi:hypothetical protein
MPNVLKEKRLCYYYYTKGRRGGGERREWLKIVAKSRWKKFI